MFEETRRDMIESFKEIQTYLDDCIKFWRNLRDDPEEKKFTEHECACYIDAFQSVRMSIFEELLP